MSMLARSISNHIVVSAEPFLVKKEECKVEVIMQIGFTFEEFQAAAMLIENLRPQYGNTKPRVFFKEETKVYHRKKYKDVKYYDTFFFVGDESKALCYSPTGRTGYFVQWDFPWRIVEKIVLAHDKEPSKIQMRDEKKEKLYKRIMNTRFDEQTWSNLKSESFCESNHRFYYIKKVFDEYTLNQIQKAFQEKKEFCFTKDDSWRNKHTKRHYKVSGKMCDDGVYRAWFSSEYIGYANGDYYLLLNPSVAVFYKKD
ncbi:hypothetical protein ACFVS2_25740 [Brevibacillus sp. NPDC058079]|uniref:hypothetical protein n=1 Tax=Brevibacillus sp. NPDC058079 TaxID=3346330 RepID=UPI0036EA3A71